VNQAHCVKRYLNRSTRSIMPFLPSFPLFPDFSFLRDAAIGAGLRVIVTDGARRRPTVASFLFCFLSLSRIPFFSPPPPNIINGLHRVHKFISASMSSAAAFGAFPFLFFPFFPSQIFLFFPLFFLTIPPVKPSREICGFIGFAASSLFFLVFCFTLFCNSIEPHKGDLGRSRAPITILLLFFLFLRRFFSFFFPSPPLQHAMRPHQRGGRRIVCRRWKSSAAFRSVPFFSPFPFFFLCTPLFS